MILPYKEFRPRLDSSVFVAPGAAVIGDVEIGADSSVWFNAVVRGDVNKIRIGERTNIQDGCVLHVSVETWALSVGSGVTVGHGAILHGCTVEDSCLIGMAATVLDGAHVGEFSLVAAGSLVREGQRVPGGSLVAGVPAIVKRQLTPAEIEGIRQSALHYLAEKNVYVRAGFSSGSEPA